MTPDQPVGPPVPGWTPPPRPAREAIEGRCVRLEPLDPEWHGPALWEAICGCDALWTYLPVGPFPGWRGFRAWLGEAAAGVDPLFFAVIDKAEGRASGWQSFLRIAPEAGSIEVGHICYSPALQGTRAATEAQYLMMSHAFAMGYRRFEWKCDALNAPSRRLAQRLGFSFEGVFRQAMVVKGRNRDTAWYSVIDAEWPALKAAFETWLDLENFDPEGRQRTRLSDLTAPLLAARG
jgi:RimJ/RimL family protein N-acetyltransferase